MNYELSFIISANVPETEHQAVQKDILGYLDKVGAKVIKEAYSIGRKKLAYPIKKQKHGFYVFLEFSLEDKDGLKGIETQLKLNNNLLRYLIIKKDPAANKQEKKQAARKLAPATKGEAAPAETKKADEAVKATPKVETTKIDLDDIDKKLDELLDQEPKID
ncbi:30S ribosomal protein S6 [Candidatus Parcubacteria bacterium]|jgi:small subunit ribosomal protein S6|nr:30S ribosomal protein S6 [Candidatus Parcubacteria bacterium]